MTLLAIYGIPLYAVGIFGIKLTILPEKDAQNNVISVNVVADENVIIIFYNLFTFEKGWPLQLFPVAWHCWLRTLSGPLLIAELVHSRILQKTAEHDIMCQFGTATGKCETSEN